MSDEPLVNTLTADSLMQLTELGLSSASLIHDLRQPVFSVRGLVQRAIARGQLDSKTASALMGSLDHLSQLLALYGELSRPKPGVFDVQTVVQRALGFIAGRAKAQGVEVQVSLGERRQWKGDSALFLQMLVNLLSNALDSLDECEQPKICVQIESTSEGWKLMISDNGPGLSESMRERCFEPYVTNKVLGTGLGLYIAQRGAQGNGGSLLLVSTEVGAVFEAHFGGVSDG